MAIISLSDLLRTSLSNNPSATPRSLISQFENKDDVDPIVVKSDLIKKIAENDENGAVLAKITLYYNVINLIYGFDTLVFINNSEIAADEHPEEKLKFSKTINLYKSLSESETSIIEYFKKARNMPSLIRKQVKPIPGAAAEDSDTVRLALEKAEATFNDAKEALQPDASFITGKFNPQLFVDNNNPDETGTIYLYSNVTQSSSNSSTRKVSVNSTLKKLISRAYKKAYGRIIGDFEPFRRACFEAINNRKDPARVFEKAFFLKSHKTKESHVGLDFIDEEILSSFIYEAELFPAGVRLDNIEDVVEEDPNHFEDYEFISPDSNLEYDVEVHNYKKIDFVTLISPLQGNAQFDFSIFLTKSSDRLKRNTVLYNRIDVSSFFNTLRDTPDCVASTRQGLDKFSPTFIGDSPESVIKEDEREIAEVSVSFRAAISEDIHSYYCSRAVSKDTNSNSTFLHQTLSPTRDNPLTTVQKVITPGNSLNRSIVLNSLTGEISYESKIFPSRAYKSPRSYTPSALLQVLDSVKLYVTTVNHSNEETNPLRNQPINKIIIKNLPPEYQVYKLYRKYEFQSGKVELPVSLSDGIIADISPIPNEKVKYFLKVRERNGSEYVSENYDLEVVHRTLPAAALDISISQQEIESEENLHIIPVQVTTSYSRQSSNVISELRDGISRIFNSEEDSALYEEQIQEKVNSTLENIGDFFKLYVCEYDLFDEEETTCYFLNPVERIEGQAENNTLFSIRVDTTNTRKLICYNLIRKNMHDILSLVEDNIEDPESKKTFRRRTSAFFNSLSLSSGVIPVQRRISGDNTENTFSFRMGNSDFRFANCLGSHVELGRNITPESLLIENLSAVQVNSTGEFILSWDLTRPEIGHSHPRGSDFFVITVCINDFEIPIGSHPSIGFQQYHYRTQSFLDIAGAVKFRVYIVYNDFRIEKDAIYETEEYVVSDMRSLRAQIR